MYPRIKLVGRFDPRYAKITEPVTEAQIKPGTLFIMEVGGWCVFKKTKDGKARKGAYKSIPDAVFSALWN